MLPTEHIPSRLAWNRGRYLTLLAAMALVGICLA